MPRRESSSEERHECGAWTESRRAGEDAGCGVGSTAFDSEGVENRCPRSHDSIVSTAKRIPKQGLNGNRRQRIGYTCWVFITVGYCGDFRQSEGRTGRWARGVPIVHEPVPENDETSSSYNCFCTVTTRRSKHKTLLCSWGAPGGEGGQVMEYGKRRVDGHGRENAEETAV